MWLRKLQCTGCNRDKTQAKEAWNNLLVTYWLVASTIIMAVFDASYAYNCNIQAQEIQNENQIKKGCSM